MDEVSELQQINESKMDAPTPVMNTEMWFSDSGCSSERTKRSGASGT